MAESSATDPQFRQRRTRGVGIVDATGDGAQPLALVPDDPGLVAVGGRIGDHAQQFDVIVLKDEGVIRRAAVGAVGAARRQRETKPAAGLGAGIQVPDQQEDVIDAFDGMGHGTAFQLNMRQSGARVM